MHKAPTNMGLHAQGHVMKQKQWSFKIKNKNKGDTYNKN